MTQKLIALDDGHGMETAGKRTPALPDGTVMRENEFNRRVVALLDVQLQRCGFRTLLVAPTDVDTTLRTRTDAANKAKADLYISVHANAFGAGGFNTERGIESFHYRSSAASEHAAK
ncbi:N-acetylmuramoyl-L-alanine amidase [Cohnella sp.]|uniref:N-acetylmuramoyl-L-alanine amidase family protein n=1 Tax=Cohnella sp. TaxID=1883426 RepID=UPI003567A826